MHRVLKLKNDQLRLIHNLFTSNRIDNNFRLTAQNNFFSNNSTRNQSTNISPSVRLKKLRKKRIRVTKKYAELLVVTNNSTEEQKATVKKLTPNDLKIFMNTNLDLSELYKLKSFSNDDKHAEEHTYNNLTVIENIPHEALSGGPLESVKTPILKQVVKEIEDVNKQVEIGEEIDEDIHHHDVIASTRHLNTFQPEVLEEEDHHETAEAEEIKEEKLPKVHQEIAASEEIVNRTLAAYVEICCNIGTPQRGLNAVYSQRIRYRKSSQKYVRPVRDIRVYNILLRGFAAKGDFKKLQEVWKVTAEEGISPDVHSYAAVLECLGRLNFDNNHLKYIRTYVKEAKRQGITFDRIVNDAVFTQEQRDMILRAILAHTSTYVPQYELQNLQYNNHLLNDLNIPEQELLLPETATKTNNGIFSSTNWNELVDKQMKLECDGFITVKSIESKAKPTEEVLYYRKVFDEHIQLWEKAGLEAFNRDLAALSAQRNALSMEPYMRCIPAKDFVKIIVEEAKKIALGSETYSPTVNLLYKDLGHKVYARYKVLRKQKSGALDKMRGVHLKFCEHYAMNHDELGVLPEREIKINPRQTWQLLEHSVKGEGSSINLDHHEWVPTALQNIGKFLYHIVMHDLKVNVNCMHQNLKHKNYLPAFYTVFRNQGRLAKEEVKPHPLLCKLHRASQQETLTFPSYELPMLCPPVPWISVQTGGYLVNPCDMVRLPPQAVLQKQRLREAEPNSLYPSFDSLNQLATVPWKVNTKVLDVILEVFNSGGSSKLDVPEPSASLKPPQSIVAGMDKTEKFQLFKQRLQYRRKKAEMYSLWCDCHYRLSLADHFRNDIFWLPHNMDFRGRVYPVPPHLNHLGSDLARSMLVFAEARPLGKHGLDWLKIHLINLTGLKKRDSITDRLNYANEIMEDILDSADNPLTGKRWWAESDEPWQTLACCMEIATASRSSDPEKFMSHFPVHQDGSCNGLQHYAALGRDSAGAHSVNLTPAEVPQDVYSSVAVLVEKQRQADAEKGLQVAKILEGFVRRKVIKQTVMTTVYGVTRFGARLQIAKQLKDIDEFPKEAVWSASSYLTARTFESLRTMFTSTREIQDWFTDCAKMISSTCGQNVEWVTPLGLPIVQPYFRYKKTEKQVIEHFQMDKYERPNVMKQKNAFPPNFVHSLDSSHMMLTSMFCERSGISFVSVHDCYWTHPSTVHIMNKICREQFVTLHSEPILENLSVFLSQKYSYSDNEFAGDGSAADLTKRKLNKVLRQLPKTGDFDIRQVLDSIYFFS